MNLTNNEPYDMGPSTNIFSTPLLDGTLFPEHLNEEDTRPYMFLSQFDRIRKKPWSECTFLDLGCNEGSSTLLLGQSGAHIIGIEGREDAVHRANYVKEQLGFNNVTFVSGNLLDQSLWRQADAIYAAGILYHMENPFGLLELISSHSEQYVYFCTHCAPRSAVQLRESGFGRRISKSDIITYRDKPILTVSVAEPEDVSEIQEHGFRRSPRSGIGNQSSIWLSNNGLADAMALLGFKAYEIHHQGKDLRFRISFFRKKPEKVVGRLDPLNQPLPKRNSLSASACVVLQKDLCFLKESQHEVIVIGSNWVLESCINLLKDHHIPIFREVIDLGSTRVLRPTELAHMLDLKRKSGLLNIVLALEDPRALYHQLMIMNCAAYIFTSFALSQKG